MISGSRSLYSTDGDRWFHVFVFLKALLVWVHVKIHHMATNRRIFCSDQSDTFVSLNKESGSSLFRSGPNATKHVWRPFWVGLFYIIMPISFYVVVFKQLKAYSNHQSKVILINTPTHILLVLIK